MATENTIKFVAKTNGRSSHELYSLLTVIYDTASLKKPDFGSGPAVVGPVDDASPGTLNLFITVLAEDDDEVVAAAETALNALRVFEIEIVGAPELVSSKPVKPRTVTTPGLDYDEAEGVLTIDTWAPDWTDVEVRLHPNGDGRVVLFLVTNERGLRMEQAVLGNTIKVRRPGGTPPEIPPGLGRRS